jgi:ubiquinone biosynthesis protein UbiJ
MIVGRDEVSEFNAEVARLRDDVARLEKRVELRERSRT